LTLNEIYLGRLWVKLLAGKAAKSGAATLGYTKYVAAHIKTGSRNIITAFKSILAAVSHVACAPSAYHIISGIPCSPGNTQEAEEAVALHCWCGMTCFKTTFGDSAPRRFPHPERSDCDILSQVAQDSTDVDVECATVSHSSWAFISVKILFNNNVT